MAWTLTHVSARYAVVTLEGGGLYDLQAPRELTLADGRLRQRPARELQQLRGLLTQWQGPAVTAPTLAADSAELQLVADGPFSLRLADSVHLDWDGQRLTLQRLSLRDGQPV